LDGGSFLLTLTRNESVMNKILHSRWTDWSIFKCQCLRSPRSLANPNHDYLSSSETGVNVGIQSSNEHFFLSPSRWWIIRDVYFLQNVNWSK
jgi:hypothetical protein